MKTALVTGSSGFIGGHLTTALQSKGYIVIGADINKPLYSEPDIFYNIDLRDADAVLDMFHENKIDEVYNLACLMGGIGFIGDRKHDYGIMVGSSLIIANILEASIFFGVNKHFYSSSACVYNEAYQMNELDCSISEDMAYPANPDLVYGWQKLFSEQMYNSAKSQGIDARIARFHNIFGTNGTWDGGKEKAPAAICRKVAQAKDGDTITIWGDGRQTRSFLYIDECIDGIFRLMDSNCIEPINLGSDELISIKDLAEMAIVISGKKISIEYDLTKPQGVRGRCSNNDKIAQVLGWKPTQKLEVGMRKTFEFVSKQVNG